MLDPRGRPEALILGNGPSLRGRRWSEVPRDRVFVIGCNQSWREFPDADAHVAVDADQYAFEDGVPYYRRMAAIGHLFHTGGPADKLKGSQKLDSHNNLVWGRNPFKKRHLDGRTPHPPPEQDGGVVLKPEHGPSGSVCYLALQIAVAVFEKVWFVGLDLGSKKFDGAHGFTGYGKQTRTDVGAWSNSTNHDRVWRHVPKDVRQKVFVIEPSLTQQLTVVPWPWREA